MARVEIVCTPDVSSAHTESSNISDMCLSSELNYAKELVRTADERSTFKQLLTTLSD